MADFQLTGKLIIGGVDTKLARAQIARDFAGIKVPSDVLNTYQKLNTNIGALNDTLTKSKAPLRNVKKGVQEVRDEIAEFGRVSGLAIRRYTGFVVATAATFGLFRKITGAIGNAIEFQKEMTKVAQITGKSTRSLVGLTNEIGRLSTTFGVSSQELVGVAKLLTQTGLSASKTQVALQALSKAALLPTFSDLTQATEGAIAILSQFRDEARGTSLDAKNLEEVFGAMNAIAGRFAVEMGDLITVIRKTGGIFTAASQGIGTPREQLEQLLALFTAVRSTTRESAETIAVGLRTIFARLQRSRTVDVLVEMGVKLRDAEDNFVGVYEALRRISQKLGTLDPRSRQFFEIIQQLGGVRQIGKVIPLIQQFEKAEKALIVAQKGRLSVNDDIVKAQQTLANQIARTREEFEKLIREISETQTFKTLIELVLLTTRTFINLGRTIREALPFLTVLGIVRGIPLAKRFLNVQRGFFGGMRGHLGQATGGLIPGSGNKDSIPALLTPGEFVINKKSVSKIGLTNLKMLNQFGKGGLVHFADGGSLEKKLRDIHGRTLENITARSVARSMVKGSGLKSLVRVQQLEQKLIEEDPIKRLTNLARRSTEAAKSKVVARTGIGKKRVPFESISPSTLYGLISSDIKPKQSIKPLPTLPVFPQEKQFEYIYSTARKELQIFTKDTRATTVAMKRFWKKIESGVSTTGAYTEALRTAETFQRKAGRRGGIGGGGGLLRGVGRGINRLRNINPVAGLLAVPFLQAGITQIAGERAGQVTGGVIGGAATGFALGGGPIGAAIGGVLGLFSSLSDNTQDLINIQNELIRSTTKIDDAFTKFTQKNDIRVFGSTDIAKGGKLRFQALAAEESSLLFGTPKSVSDVAFERSTGGIFGKTGFLSLSIAGLAEEMVTGSSKILENQQKEIGKEQERIVNELRTPEVIQTGEKALGALEQFLQKSGDLESFIKLRGRQRLGARNLATQIVGAFGTVKQRKTLIDLQAQGKVQLAGEKALEFLTTLPEVNEISKLTEIQKDLNKTYNRLTKAANRANIELSRSIRSLSNISVRAQRAINVGSNYALANQTIATRLGGNIAIGRPLQKNVFSDIRLRSYGELFRSFGRLQEGLGVSTADIRDSLLGGLKARRTIEKSMLDLKRGRSSRFITKIGELPIDKHLKEMLTNTFKKLTLGGKEEQEVLKILTDEIVNPFIDVSLNAARSLQDGLNQANERYIQAVENQARIQANINTRIANVANLRIQQRNVRTTLFGGRLTMRDVETPLSAQIRALTGLRTNTIAFNPKTGYTMNDFNNLVSRINERITKLQERRTAIESRLQDGISKQESMNMIRELGSLETQLKNHRNALELLATNTDKLAFIQNRLVEIEQQRQRIRGGLLGILQMGPEEIQRAIFGQLAIAQVRRTGQYPETHMGFQRLFTGIQGLEPFLTQEEQELAYTRILKAFFTQMGIKPGPRLGAGLQMRGQGIEEQRLAAQLQQAQEVMLRATNLTIQLDQKDLIIHANNSRIQLNTTREALQEAVQGQVGINQIQADRLEGTVRHMHEININGAQILSDINQEIAMNVKKGVSEVIRRRTNPVDNEPLDGFDFTQELVT